jgi:hypothetical protein
MIDRESLVRDFDVEIATGVQTRPIQQVFPVCT